MPLRRIAVITDLRISASIRSTRLLFWAKDRASSKLTSDLPSFGVQLVIAMVLTSLPLNPMLERRVRYASLERYVRLSSRKMMSCMFSFSPHVRALRVSTRASDPRAPHRSPRSDPPSSEWSPLRMLPPSGPFLSAFPDSRLAGSDLTARLIAESGLAVRLGNSFSRRSPYGCDKPSRRNAQNDPSGQMIRPIPVVCVTGAAKTRRCTMTAGRGMRTRVSVGGVLFPQPTVFSGCRILTVRGHLFIYGIRARLLRPRYFSTSSLVLIVSSIRYRTMTTAETISAPRSAATIAQRPQLGPDFLSG